MTALVAEIQTEVGTLYRAPGGTARPTVLTATPGAPWVAFGDVSEPIDIAGPLTIERIRGRASRLVRKTILTEESVTISSTLLESTIAQHATIWNDATVTTVAAASGVPGSKEFDLERGSRLATFALLYIGFSPEMDGGVEEYYWPYVSQVGDATISHSGDGPAGIAFEFEAIKVAGVSIGKRRVQTAAALA